MSQKPKVYFYKNINDLKTGLNKFFDMISKDTGKDNIGLKIHFGEKNNDTHISPELLEDAGEYFNNPKFVECNVLYRGLRTKKKDHIEIAKKHGFDFLDIDILDGELGEQTIEVPINTKNTKNAKLGKGLTKYKKLVALTHFKGHGMTGFGGALKNLGMGLGSRSGKLDMHSSVSPNVDQNICTGCGECAKNCDVNAIEINGKAKINLEKCVGCAMCISVCPVGAIQIPWSSDTTERLLEKIAEYTLAAVKGKNWWYINVVNNITMRCDCHAEQQKPFMKDIGVLLSNDPIAIDQASIDLIKKSNGGKNPFEEYNATGGEYILEYGESLGLGSREYELELLE